MLTNIGVSHVEHQKALRKRPATLQFGRRISLLLHNFVYQLCTMRPLIALAESCTLLQVEGIAIDEEGLAFMGELGESTTLRHVVQLLTPSMMLAKTNGRDTVSRGDLEELASLFHDAKFSAKLLAEQADKYIT